MRCYRVARLLSDHLDGVLDTAVEAGVKGHLARCASCSSACARLERTRALVAEARAPEPGDGYWAEFWPRLEERLAEPGEFRVSLAERLSLLILPGRLAGLLSPVPALVILALVCFNVFLLTQVRRGVPGDGVRPEAVRGLDPAERPLPSLAANGGTLEIGRGTAPRSGVDAVLCDSGGRVGIDEYVLQPAAFHRSNRSPRSTEYILTRAVEVPTRGESQRSY